MICVTCWLFFFSSRRRHTRCALVTGVQTCALPICAAGHTTLSAGAVLLLAGCGTQQSAHAADPAADADILNSALGAEQEAIAAYQVGAESGLLTKPVLDLAVQFQGHHKEHADVLAKGRKSTRLNSSH